MATITPDPAEHLTDASSAITTGEAIVARSQLEMLWLRLRRDRVVLGALVFVGLLIIAAIFAPLVVKLVGARPPNAQSTKFLDVDGSPTGPSVHALFGVDALGRDVFSRTLYGARTSLEVALLATAVTVTIGVTAGMLAGYHRGWVDTILARVMDVMLAFPALLLAIGLAAACSIGNGCLTLNLRHAGLLLIAAGIGAAAWQTYAHARRRRRAALPRRPRLRALAPRWAAGAALTLGGLACLTLTPSHSALIQPGVPVLVFVLALGGTPYIARIIRGQTLSLRETEFVEALEALGASHGRVITRHLLPNLAAPIIVYTTLLIPVNILFEAALSFLGVGVQPPTASWGAMISDATGIFNTAWWYMTFPGLALVLTVLAFSLIGDGLQDALSHRRRG